MDALTQVRLWVRKQRSTPWTEASFASRMTGEEGYDAALEEVAAMVEDHRPCTYRPARQEACGRPELDPIHPLEGERMGHGKHVYRTDGR